MNKFKMKLTVNKDGGEAPQYSLSYKANLKEHTSYAVLSALIGDRDVAAIASTDLSFAMGGKEYRDVNGFAERVKAKGLTHRDRIVPSNRPLNLFGFSIKRKNKEQAREIAVYIPNAVWRQEDTPGLLPVYGVQYFAAKAPMDPEETVERILDMSRAERAEAFAMDVYDISAMGQMGINAPGVGEEELKRLLGL